MSDIMTKRYEHPGFFIFLPYHDDAVVVGGIEDITRKRRYEDLTGDYLDLSQRLIMVKAYLTPEGNIELDISPADFVSCNRETWSTIGWTVGGSSYDDPLEYGIVTIDFETGKTVNVTTSRYMYRDTTVYQEEKRVRSDYRSIIQGSFVYTYNGRSFTVQPVPKVVLTEIAEFDEMINGYISLRVEGAGRDGEARPSRRSFAE